MPREMKKLIDSINPLLQKLNITLIRNLYDYLSNQSNIPDKLVFEGIQIDEKDHRAWEHIYREIELFLKTNIKSKNFLIQRLKTDLVLIINKQSENTSSGPPKKRHKDEFKNLERNAALEQVIAEACNKVRVPSIGHTTGFQRCKLDAKGEKTNELASVILIYPPENLSTEKKYEYGQSIVDYIKSCLDLTKRSMKNILLKPLDKKEIDAFNKNDNRYETNENIIAEITIPLIAPSGTVAIRGQTQVAIKQYFTDLPSNPAPHNKPHLSKKAKKDDSRKVAGLLASLDSVRGDSNSEQEDVSSSETSRSDSLHDNKSYRSAGHENFTTSSDKTLSKSIKPLPPTVSVGNPTLKPQPRMKMNGAMLSHDKSSLGNAKAMIEPQQPAANPTAAPPKQALHAHKPTTTEYTSKKAAARNRLRAQDFFSDETLEALPAQTPSAIVPTTVPTLKATAKQQPALAVSKATVDQPSVPNASGQSVEATTVKEATEPANIALNTTHPLTEASSRLIAPMIAKPAAATDASSALIVTAIPAELTSQVPTDGAKPAEVKVTEEHADTTSNEKKRKREEEVSSSEKQRELSAQDIKLDPSAASTSLIMKHLQGTSDNPLKISDDERESNERQDKIELLSKLKEAKNKELALAEAAKKVEQDKYKEIRDKKRAAELAKIKQLEDELKDAELKIEEAKRETEKYRRVSTGS